MVLASIRKPKRIIIRGDDEKDHMFLVKGGEDLRLDQRIEQVSGDWAVFFGSNEFYLSNVNPAINSPLITLCACKHFYQYFKSKLVQFKILVRLQWFSTEPNSSANDSLQGTFCFLISGNGLIWWTVFSLTWSRFSPSVTLFRSMFTAVWTNEWRHVGWSLV